MPEHTPYSKMSLTRRILDRQIQLEDIRAPYDPRMAEIIDYCDPGLTEWSNRTHSSSNQGSSFSSGGVWSFDNGVEGRFRGQKIYEGTPSWGLRVMADGWIGSLVSQVRAWMKYQFPDKELRGNDDINKWMQDLEDHMIVVYRNSELYPALGPYARAGLSVGSPVIMPWDDTKRGKIRCDVPHPKENYHGPYDSYHRKYMITVVDAVNRFMDGKVPDDSLAGPLSFGLIEDWKHGRHGNRHEFIRAIYREDDPILDGQPAKFKNKPWMEFYVETPKGGASDREHINIDPVLVEGDFIKPHIRWDWEINTDEYYARTPSWHAINDIKSGQELERQKLEVGQRNLKPPMWLMKKYRNQFTGNPGSSLYYDTPSDQAAKPEPILDGSNWQIGDEQSKQMRRGVERWYQTDFFQAITKLTAENTGAWPTLGQLLQLSGEKAVVLGPRIGQFTKVLVEIDDRFFDIENRKGNLPPPPDIVLEWMARKQAEDPTFKTFRLDIEFLGTLAVLQERAETLGRSEEALAIISAYAELDPMVLHGVRLDVQMEKDLESIRFSQEAMVPKDERDAIKEAIAEAEAAERQAEQQLAAAQAVPGLSKEVEEGSVLANISEAAVA